MNSLRQRTVSKDLILSWIETGLRSIKGIENGEDLVHIDFDSLKNETIQYTVKPKELEVEVILHNG